MKTAAKFAALALVSTFQEFALAYCAEKTQGRRRPVGMHTVRRVDGKWSVGYNGSGDMADRRDASTAYAMVERSPLRALAMGAEALRYSILCPAPVSATDPGIATHWA